MHWLYEINDVHIDVKFRDLRKSMVCIKYKKSTNFNWVRIKKFLRCLKYITRKNNNEIFLSYVYIDLKYPITQIPFIGIKNTLMACKIDILEHTLISCNKIDILKQLHNTIPFSNIKHTQYLVF